MKEGWTTHGEKPRAQAINSQAEPTTKPTSSTRSQAERKVKSTKSTWIIDSREPGKMSSLFDTYKMKYRIAALDSGDLELGNAAAERKTIHDFIGSYKSGRVFDQLERLSKRTTVPFLMLTGTPEEVTAAIKASKRMREYLDFNPNQMLGALASCLCRYNLNVIWTRTDADGVRILRALFPHLKDTVVEADKPQSYTLLAGDMPTLRGLWGDRDYKDGELAHDIAAMIKEGTNIIWVYDESLGLRALSKMFKKINEGKYGAPRKRIVKKSGMGRSTDLLRTYLRIEGSLAKSLLKEAKRKHVGVMRYILEAPDSSLLVHPGMGNVTLKRVRELIG